MEDNKKTYEELEMDLAISQEAEAKAKEIAETTQKQAEQSAAEVDELKKKNADLKRLNTELKNEVAAVQNKKGIVENEKFEFNGETYEILTPRILVPGHGTLTALELTTNEAAQATLINSGSGAIKKLA